MSVLVNNNDSRIIVQGFNNQTKGNSGKEGNFNSSETIGFESPKRGMEIKLRDIIESNINRNIRSIFLNGTEIFPFSGDTFTIFRDSPVSYRVMWNEELVFIFSIQSNGYDISNFSVDWEFGNVNRLRFGQYIFIYV